MDVRHYALNIMKHFTPLANEQQMDELISVSEQAYQEALTIQNIDLDEDPAKLLDIFKSFKHPLTEVQLYRLLDLMLTMFKKIPIESQMRSASDHDTPDVYAPFAFCKYHQRRIEKVL